MSPLRPAISVGFMAGTTNLYIRLVSYFWEKLFHVMKGRNGLYLFTSLKGDLF